MAVGSGIISTQTAIPRKIRPKLLGFRSIALEKESLRRCVLSQTVHRVSHPYTRTEMKPRSSDDMGSLHFLLKV